METNISSQEKFKGPITLLKETWQIFFSKAKTLLAIAAIPIVFKLLIDILFFFYYPTSTPAWILWIALFLLFLFFQLLVTPSLLFAVKENLFLKEAYQKGLKFFLSYLWVYFLVAVIVVGGFLLFIIPGIIFLIWFSLAVVILVFEEKRGMLALFQSKQLIAGRWWGVFWRLLVFNLIFGAIFLISSFFLRQIAEEFSYLFPLFILPLFILPFGLIYRLLIYKNLKEIKEVSSPELFPKSRKIKYGVIAFLGLLIVVPIMVLVILNTVFGRDELPPEDRDLLLSKVEISTKENALYHFLPYYDSLSKERILAYYWPEAKEKLKESKEIYWPTNQRERIEEIINGKEWDEKLTKDIVEKNQESFEDFEKFIQSPYFQNPVHRDPASFGIDLPFLPFNQYPTFAKLSLLRSIYLFKQNKEKEAFDETIKVIKMGQLLEDSPIPSMSEYLVGIDIKRMGFENLRAMIKKTDLPADLLKTYTRELSRFYAKKKPLEKNFKAGYIYWINTKTKFIDPVLKGEKLSKEEKILFEGILPSVREKFLENREKSLLHFSYFYKPNQTKRFLAEEFRHQLEAVNEESCQAPEIIPLISSYGPQEIFTEEIFTEDLRGKTRHDIMMPLISHYGPKVIFTENLIGKTLHDFIMAGFGNVFEKRCFENFSVASTQLLMAIKAYQTEHGKLPDSLEELVPEYILELPKDPFDKEVVRYSPEKKIIYSVGPNGKDEGGSEGEKIEKMPDPTFKIEF